MSTAAVETRHDQEMLTAWERVVDFNNRFPVGSPVVYQYEDGGILKTVTRSPAWALHCGIPVVSIDGKSGGVHIDCIEGRSV